MASKFRVMKFDGDDCYSYAVFRVADVKGLRSPVFYGQAKPLVSGCGKSEADTYNRDYEQRTN